MTGSWKTTLGGILSAIGLSLGAMSDPLFHLLGTILGAVGVFLIGLAARDNSVSSASLGLDKK